MATDRLAIVDAFALAMFLLGAVPVGAPLPQFAIAPVGSIQCCPSPFFLGPRTKDGIGKASAFDRPSGIAYDRDDDAFFITDGEANVVRRYDPSTGAVSTIAGACDIELYQAACKGSEVDGSGATARFDRPGLIVYDHLRHSLVVYDAGTSRLRRISIDGRVNTIASVPDLTGLAVGQGGILYGAQRCSVVEIESDLPIWSRWTLPDPQDDCSAPIRAVNYIVVDPSTGDLYAVVGVGSIYRIPRNSAVATKIAGTQATLTLGAEHYEDGKGAAAALFSIAAIAFDPVRHVVVATDFRSIRTISPDGTVVKIAGACATKYANRGEFSCDYPAQDGPASIAHFALPGDLAVDSERDSILVVDDDTLRTVDRHFDVTTVAGNHERQPSRLANVWDGRYLDTVDGSVLDVYVRGDDEVEVLRDPSGRIYDAKEGSRREATGVEQFWTGTHYVRQGVPPRLAYQGAYQALACGRLADKGATNPIAAQGTPIFGWYGSFRKDHVARYSESATCVALDLRDATGTVVYRDVESRIVPHPMSDYGLAMYRDQRRQYP